MDGSHAVSTMSTNENILDCRACHFVANLTKSECFTAKPKQWQLGCSDTVPLAMVSVVDVLAVVMSQSTAQTNCFSKPEW